MRTNNPSKPTKRLRTTGGALLAGSLLLGALAGPASADGASFDPDAEARPALLSTDLPAVLAGTNSWINVMWMGDGTVSDLQVEARATRGVTVSYSETTGDHSGPMNGYELSANETDFTAIKVDVPEGLRSSGFALTLDVTWTAGGETHREKMWLQVPVVQHSGDDWEMVASAGSSSNGWYETAVLGLAPKSDRLRFEFGDDAGTNAYLPQGTWTGPHHDSLIEWGETDYVRFYVEPGSMPAGEYTLSFDTSWVNDGESKTKTVPFTITVD